MVKVIFYLILPSVCMFRSRLSSVLGATTEAPYQWPTTGK